MKLNWFKYVFIIFIIVILVYAIYKIKNDDTTKIFEQQINTTESEKIRELKIGITSIDTINPILSKNKNVQDVQKLIYEPLVDLTSDYKAKPCLAKEWAKQGDNSYIIKLRENVKWSNGQIFTSDDVKFTIDKLKEISSIYSYNVQHIIGLDKVDDFTIKINLDEEIPFFEYNLTFPILSKEYYENEDFSSTEKNSTTIGTGKYKISEVDSSSIILEKNAYWWNKEQKLSIEKIILNLYSSVGEMYNSFKIGNIDLIATDNDNIQEYIGTIGYNSKEIKGRNHTFLAFNTTNYFLSKQEIRKAIAYSIDKDNIVSSVFENKNYTSSFPLDYGNWLAQEQDTSSGYNTEQAKQLLIDSGWTYRNQYWQKYEDGRNQKIFLNLLVKASDNSKVLVAENIKSQLEAQGIRINIIKASDEQYINSINAGSYDIALVSIILSPSPNLNTFFGENNLAKYTNEEVNGIMNEIKNISDENTLNDKYKRLIEVYKIDIPYISLYFNKYIIAYNSGLIGELTPNWYSPFYGIENWYK